MVCCPHVTAPCCTHNHSYCAPIHSAPLPPLSTREPPPPPPPHLPRLLPPPPYKQNMHTGNLPFRPLKKVNGTGKNVWKQLVARFREWRKKINKHSTISPFSNHSNWPSHPFPLVLSLYRALLISYSFFSAACPHWPSYPSRPADGELGIHLPSGWATESEKVNYCWIQRRCK